MSSVDERIVKMTFDGDKFHQGVQKTLEYLDKLKEKLNFKDSEKMFKGVEMSANNVRFDGMESGIEALNKRFSTLGVVGIEVTRRLTNAAIDAGKRIGNATLGQIKSGGMSRALNIEQARFQLKGLGLDVKEVMQNASDAVDGTAYGLDEAAKAASVLGSSGVKAGKEMESVLKSISGAAAMTGRSYSDIANIYSTVASNGKLMTMQLRQFAASGLNVSAVLAKAMNTTEENINEMVADGKISFADFNKAMSEFGEHAKEANNTYDGALSNMKSALSRIGQLFTQPYIKDMRRIFNAARIGLNEVKAALEPFAHTVSVAMWHVKNFIVNGLQELGGKQKKNGKWIFGDIGHLVQGLVNILEAFLELVRPIKRAFTEMFPKATFSNLGKLISRFKEWTETLSHSKKETENLVDFYKGIFSILKLVASVVKTVFDGVNRIFKPLGGFLNVLNAIVGFVGRLVSGVVGAILKVRLLSRIFTIITTVISGVIGGIVWFVDVVKKVFNAIKNSKPVVAVVEAISNAFKTARRFISAFVDKIKEFVSAIAEWVGGATISAVSKFVSLVSSGLSVASKGLSKVIGKVKELVNKIKQSKQVQAIVKGISDGVETLRGYLTIAIDKVKEFAKTLADWVKEHHVVQEFFGILKSGLELAIGALIVAANKVKEFGKKIYDFLNDTGLLEKFIELFHDGMDKIKDVIEQVADKVKDFGEYITTNLKSPMERTASAATDMHEKIAKAFVFRGIKKVLKTFSDAGGIIADVFTVLSGGLTSFYQKYLEPVLDRILDTVSKWIQDFVGLFKGLDMKDILHYFPLEAFGVFLLSLSGFISQSKKSVKAVRGSVEAITGFFDTLSARLKGELDGKSKWKRRGETLLMFAGAMFVFAVSIQKLGQMKGGDLAKGLVGVAVAIGLMTASLVILAKVIDKTILVNPKQIGIGMLAMAGGVLVLSFAVERFGKVDWKTMGKGFLAVIAALTVLSVAVRFALGAADHMVSTAIGLTILSAALLALAGVIKLYSKFDWEKTFGPGLLAVGSLLMALGVAVKLMGSANHMASTGVGILLIATSLFIFKVAIEKIAAVDTKSLVKGMLAVITLLGALAGAIFVIGKTNDLSGTSKAIISLTLSLAAITVMIKALSGIDIGKLVTGFVGLAGTLMAMVAALKLMEGVKDLGKSVVSLLALTTAMVAIGVAVKMLSAMPLANMAVAFGGLVVMIIAMAGALKLLGGGGMGGGPALMAAGAMAAMAASILVLSGALLVLSSIPVQNLAISVGLLAATLLVLAGVGALAGFPLVSAGLMALSVALLAIGGTILLVSMGFSLFTAALTELATLGPESMTRVVEGLTEFMNQLALAAPQLAVSAVTIVSFFIAGLLSLIPAIAMAGVSMIVALLGGIAANIGTIATMAGLIIARFILGIAAMLPAIINSGLLLITGFILGMADGIRNNSKLLFDAVKSLLEAIAEMFLDFLQSITESIPVVGKKISSGLESAKGALRDAFNVEDIDSSYKESLDKANAEIQAVTPELGKSSEGAKDAVTGPFKDIDLNGDINLDSLVASLTEGKGPLSEAASGAAEGVPEGFESVLGNMDFSSTDPNEMLASIMNATSGKPANAAKSTSDKVVKELNKTPKRALSSGKNISSSFGSGISAGKAVSAAKTASERTAKAFASSKGEASKAGKNMAKSYASGVESSDSKSKANSAGEAVANSAKAGASGVDFTSAGTACLSGLLRGLQNGSLRGQINAAARQAAQEAFNAAKKALDSNSPSKKFIKLGEDSDRGLIIGLMNMRKGIYKAGKSVGQTAVDSVSNPMKKVYELLNSDMDMNPTITPVLDLSNVSKGISQMNGMLDTRRLAANVSANMSTLGFANAGGYIGGNTTSNSVNNNFNINVNGTEDPEAFADRLLGRVQIRSRMG